jgi:hypothetical protein
MFERLFSRRRPYHAERRAAKLITVETTDLTNSQEKVSGGNLY